MSENNYAYDVSIIVPIHNELENVRLLCDEVCSVMEDDHRSWELLLIDDGSFDGTVDEICRIGYTDDRVKVVLLTRNFGQTAAMHAGIQFANGRSIVTLDGDLQNDPRDIPMMLDHLTEGVDLVHGWRKRRHDAWHRKIPSRVANRLISKVTRFKIHDLGCTLKAMRTEFAKKLELYGEMHRFIPILANQLGARCVEVETRHHPRRFGKTKYGLGRTFRVILDLITVKYMQSYFDSPMKLFGSFGLWTCLLSAVAFVGAGLMKVVNGVDLTGNPLMLLGMLSAILSVQFFSLGLLGEVNARIYFSKENRKNYQIRFTINLTDQNKDQSSSAIRAHKAA